MFWPFSWMLKGYGTVCLPHVCPEHEVKKPTRMGEDVFFHSFPLHLKFKAMKFFTVRDIPGIPREMFGRNHRHVPAGGKVAVCACLYRIFFQQMNIPQQ